MTLIDRFADEHFALNQISPRRQDDVRSSLALLDAWLPAPIEQVTPADLREWMTELVESGLNVNTVRWRLNAVKPFLRWLRQAKVIDGDAWVELSEVRPPRGATSQCEPRPYTRKELDAFWRALDERYPTTTDYYLRRYARGTSPIRRVRTHCQHAQVEAIVKLALYCGLRRTEIYALSIDDMHPDNAYLVVHGKREDHRPKVREVAYSEGAREAVTAWFRCRRMLAPLHNAPWITLGRNTLEPLEFGSLAHMLGKIGTGYALHRFRHTCATERLRQRMPLEELRDFLGHADIQQTLEYAKLLRDDIARSIEQTEGGFEKAVGRRAA